MLRRILRASLLGSVAALALAAGVPSQARLLDARIYFVTRGGSASTSFDTIVGDDIPSLTSAVLLALGTLDDVEEGGLTFGLPPLAGSGSVVLAVPEPASATAAIAAGAACALARAARRTGRR